MDIHITIGCKVECIRNDLVRKNDLLVSDNGSSESDGKISIIVRILILNDLNCDNNDDGIGGYEKLVSCIQSCIVREMIIGKSSEEGIKRCSDLWDSIGLKLLPFDESRATVQILDELTEVEIKISAVYDHPINRESLFEINQLEFVVAVDDGICKMDMEGFDIVMEMNSSIGSNQKHENKRLGKIYTLLVNENVSSANQQGKDMFVVEKQKKEKRKEMVIHGLHDLISTCFMNLKRRFNMHLIPRNEWIIKNIFITSISRDITNIIFQSSGENDHQSSNELSEICKLFDEEGNASFGSWRYSTRNDDGFQGEMECQITERLVSFLENDLAIIPKPS